MFSNDKIILDQAKLSKLYLNYSNISSFGEKHNNIDFIKYTYYALQELSLFAIDPDLDFNLLELYIEKIIETLPAIKHIFAKPLLHLKEESVIMPVEAVRHINKDTIEHLGTHSELWDNIKNNTIKPSKLLTRVYNDNYGIYENLIFCNLVDKVLAFTKKNIRLLKDLILAKQTIELNLLERVHHLQYFLALGKLYTGYVKFFDQFYDASQEDLGQLTFIYNTLKDRLHRPVYKNNLKMPKKLPLRKTNILAMHKDYRRIYTLTKILDKRDLKTNPDFNDSKLIELEKNYFHFCQLLMLFAINHFNFEFEGSQVLNFDSLNLKGNFKNWDIEISNRKTEQYDIIQLTISRNTYYKIAFIPIANDLGNRQELLQEIIENVHWQLFADEYVICTPYEHDEYLDGECFLSISNVESFRRIQQIVLRGMVYSDNQRNECPFCTNNLTIDEETTSSNTTNYVCKSCRTVISDSICPETNKKYSSTNILYLRQDPIENEDFSEEDRWLFYRKLESQMFFRNITKINNNMEILCPHCKKVHQ